MLNTQSLFFNCITVIKIALSHFSITPVLSKSPDFSLIRLTRNSIHHVANSVVNVENYLCGYFE